MNIECDNKYNPDRVPFHEMSYRVRELLRRDFEFVEWYSTDDGEWRKPPFKEPGKMNKEAYRIPPESRPLSTRRNG